MTERHKFKIGQLISHFGIYGVVRELKMGGYLVDYDNGKCRQFAYESELTSAEHIEDDRGKHRWSN